MRMEPLEHISPPSRERSEFVQGAWDHVGQTARMHLFWISLMCAATACGAGKHQRMSSNAELVRSLFIDYFNTGKTDRLGDLVAPEYTGGGPEVGPVAFGAVIARLRDAFPDLTYTLDDVVASGDRVAVRWTWRGTHRGAFRRHPATGKQVTNTGTAIFQIVNGKIAHGWLETDRLGFLQQIGAVTYEP
jgi:steroid delta-isomerase-like uncharacterized protein